MARHGWYLGTVILIVLAAVTLLLMGREPICQCGYVKLWHGATVSAESSQHLTDWYTPSHIIHGILFYAALALTVPRASTGLRLFLATAIEVAWEIVENSDTVIERYRTVTIALDYYGDSVVNSVFDIFAMVLGFWLARSIPAWASAAIVIALEALTAIVIRDGLALNVLMLLYPVDAVLDWQSGG
ncbi:DUF2585 domain-containing protein [Futiania mangrovi]|uniref:DUF2585 domain-containing protein n=1 Tax=Futiania mangrovi TaxID=2959716 RepID=A0A9J6PNZ8_9PROT|nr:DUF2585 domain-containing protein [Futiania mangrovii]MCP1337818.1 DUF2585 domain-containing protein [Futiania mangrovii]